MVRWTRALVTGASAGIGEAMARELAARGVHLVLVARRTDRLEHLRAELTGVEVEVCAADLGDAGDLERVAARCAATTDPVDLLVNNAGFGGYGKVWERPFAEARGQIDVNVTALVRLSHAAAGAMVAAGRGSILNVSSVAGNQPGPGSAVYGATKAFVTSFSEALAVELRGTGVTVTVSCPGLTHTEFHDVAGVHTHPADQASFLWMDARSVALDALDATAKGSVVRVHGWPNRVLAAASHVSPRAVRRAAAGRVVSRLRPR
jgi:short-subunit dehydrogenase